MLRFIRCWAGGQAYALDMAWAGSIQRVNRLQRLPGTRGEVGWLWTAGYSIPVWALAERLGAAVQGESAAQRVIVLNDPARPWGLLVDAVSQVTAVPESQSFPLPDWVVNREKPYFSGALLWQNELLLRLAPAALHPDAVVTASRGVESAPARDNERAGTGNGRLRHVHSGQIVVFKLPLPSQAGSDFSFALSVAQVPEVLDPLPVMPVPHAPPYAQGLINWRRRPVAVIDMGRWLGLADEASGHGRLRLMIARATASNTLIGFLALPFMRVLRLPLPHRPADGRLPLKSELLRGAVQSGDETILIPAV